MKRQSTTVKGSYLLIARLDSDLYQLPVGRLGRFDFRSGYYLYVGSAYGPGGLQARLAYHQRREKVRPHWHFDYLRPYTDMLETWTIASFQHLEIAWCAALSKEPELHIPVRGFGSSDTECTAHLFYTPVRPSIDLLTRTVLACLPFGDPDEQKLTIEVHTHQDLP